MYKSVPVPEDGAAFHTLIGMMQVFLSFVMVDSGIKEILHSRFISSSLDAY